VAGALGAIALIGITATPETSAPVATAQSGRALSGLFLATTVRHSSHALSGATLFLVFSSGVAAQLATIRLPALRVLVLGTISMLTGLVLVVTAVRLSTPSLALFLLSGALIGAGAGAVFKGTTGLVLGLAIVVGLGVAGARALLGRALKGAGRPA
jgi:hypothetical protein